MGWSEDIKVCSDVLDAVAVSFGEGMEDFAQVSRLTFSVFCVGDLIMFLETRHFSSPMLLWLLCSVSSAVSANELLDLLPAKWYIGGLYFNISTTIAGFQSRVGCLFFLVSRPSVTTIMLLIHFLKGALIAFSSLSALYNIVEIRPLFLRERSGFYYRWVHYWCSKIFEKLTVG